jgi:hypothetical protein
MTEIKSVEESKPTTLPAFLEDTDKKLRLLNGEKVDLDETQLTTTLELAKRINDNINKLASIDKLNDPKKFKLRRSIKGNIEKAFKKNCLIVIVLKKGRYIEPKVYQLHNGCIVINKVPHPVDKDVVFLWQIGAKQYPTVVIPEYEILPLGTETWYKNNPTGLDATSAAKIIYGYSKSNEVKGGTGGGNIGLVIAGVVAVAVVIFIISGGTK